MFCETCGQQFFGQESVCTHCGAIATRYWLQLVGLAVFLLALAINALAPFFLLPPCEATQPQPVLQAWTWVNGKLFAYGWAAVALAILLWAFWPREGYELPAGARVSRWLLVLLLLAGVVTLLLPWIPGTETLRASLAGHPGWAPVLAWGLLTLILGVLSSHSEARDALLGTGRVLSLAGLGLLLLVLLLVALGASAG